MKKELLFIFSFLLFISCQSDDNVTPEPEFKRNPLTPSELVMVEKGNDFAFRFFKNVYEFENEPNLFISPLSASLALAMTNNGASGNTQKEMMQTLGFGNVTREDMNSYFKKVITNLSETDPTVIMDVANSIWINKGYYAKETFKTTNKDYYNAEVGNLDFLLPSSLEFINKWCADKTNNKIDEILDKISAETQLILLNALYFKGNWKYEFDKEKTRNSTFINEKGVSQDMKLMNQECEVNYLKNETFAIAELPYGNESFGMVVLLPDESLSINQAIESLTFENWDKWNKEMTPVELSIYLPQFKLEYEKELNDILKKMGMIDAFYPNADFSDISDPSDLFIGLVKQKTFVEVNEKGTEAAAVTVVGMKNTAVPENVSFVVDRPFIFAIQEKATGIILFMGKVGSM